MRGRRRRGRRDDVYMEKLTCLMLYLRRDPDPRQSQPSNALQIKEALGGGYSLPQLSNAAGLPRFDVANEACISPSFLRQPLLPRACLPSLLRGSAVIWWGGRGRWI